VTIGVTEASHANPCAASPSSHAAVIVHVHVHRACGVTRAGAREAVDEEPITDCNQ